MYMYIYMDLKNIFNDTLNTVWGVGLNSVLESTKYLLTVCMYIYIYIYMDLKNIFNDTLNTFWGAGPNSATKS